jgi:hypothetical protein
MGAYPDSVSIILRLPDYPYNSTTKTTVVYLSNRPLAGLRGRVGY